MPKTLKIKVESDQVAISDFLDRIKEFYVVAHVSKLIEHREDDLSHIYISLVDVGE